MSTDPTYPTGPDADTSEREALAATVRKHRVDAERGHWRCTCGWVGLFGTGPVGDKHLADAVLAAGWSRSPRSRVQGRCPACGATSLFLGAGDYVTCSRLECREPDAATAALESSPRPAPAVEDDYAAAERILDAALPHLAIQPDVIHLSDPETGPSYCGEPVTLIKAEGDARPICQTCHRGAMKSVRSGWCPCAAGRPQHCKPEEWPMSRRHGLDRTHGATIRALARECQGLAGRYTRAYGENGDRVADLLTEDTYRIGTAILAILDAATSPAPTPPRPECDVAAEALREVADLLAPFSGIGMGASPSRVEVSQWLRDYADEIAQPPPRPEREEAVDVQAVIRALRAEEKRLVDVVESASPFMSEWHSETVAYAAHDLREIRAALARSSAGDPTEGGEG